MSAPRKNIETPQYVLFLTSEFSQWFPSEFVDDQGHRFSHAEQYMMYQKAVLFGDLEIAQKILEAQTPDEQKALGRAVKGFDKDVWDAHARNIVYQGNHYKFTQNPHLWEVLNATGDRRLAEAAHYDPVWGIGLRAEDPRAQDETQWQGKNWLGETLTKLRDDLRAQGFAPQTTSENKWMFVMYDADGQRNLYISAQDLAAQARATIQETVKELSAIPVREAAHMDIALQINGHGEVREKMIDFLSRNGGLIAQIEVETNPEFQAFLRQRDVKPGSFFRR